MPGQSWRRAWTALVGAIAATLGRARARPECRGHEATIVRNNGDNEIRGTNGRDVIVAKGGVDFVDGRGGRDVDLRRRRRPTSSRAAAGNDVIVGETGDDLLLGGEAKDKLFGKAGKDGMQGEGGTGDLCSGGSGDDLASRSNCERIKSAAGALSQRCLRSSAGTESSPVRSVSEGGGHGPNQSSRAPSIVIVVPEKKSPAGEAR